MDNKNNYQLMSNIELENEMNTLSEQYEEFKTVIKEAYDAMNELSNKYQLIKDILDKRNVRHSK